jgi:SpoOM protein
MGLWDKIKGWFNIGGVKVKLSEVSPTVSKKGNAITGKAILTSKSDKQVLGLDYKFNLRKTTGSGEEKKVKDIVIGEAHSTEAFEIKADETKTVDFTIPYSIEKTLADMGGVLGAIGKVGNFISGDKLEYTISVSASVKGAAFDTSDTMTVTVVD